MHGNWLGDFWLLDQSPDFLMVSLEQNGVFLVISWEIFRKFIWNTIWNTFRKTNFLIIYWHHQNVTKAGDWSNHQKPNSSLNIINNENCPKCYKIFKIEFQYIFEHNNFAQNWTSNLPNILTNQKVRKHRRVRPTSKTLVLCWEENPIHVTSKAVIMHAGYSSVVDRCCSENCMELQA